VVFAAEICSAVTRAECERLAELAVGRTVLEVGSFFGRSTIALATTAAVVHAVDPHPLDNPAHIDEQQRSTLEALRRSLRDRALEEKVVIHVATSPQLLPVLRRVFDFVFIDAAHEREEVERDIRLALGCLRLPGVLAFHDYGRAGIEWEGEWYPFGVTEAVDELVARRSDARLEVIESLAVVSLQPGLYRVAWAGWRRLPAGARLRLRTPLRRLAQLAKESRMRAS
jgi:SAM-dependent methyltransferase